MYLHPVTIAIGVVSTVLLLLLVGVGLSCVSYKMNGTGFLFIEQLFQLSKIFKVC